MKAAKNQGFEWDQAESGGSLEELLAIEQDAEREEFLNEIRSIQNELPEFLETETTGEELTLASITHLVERGSENEISRELDNKLLSMSAESALDKRKNKHYLKHLLGIMVVLEAANRRKNNNGEVQQMLRSTREHTTQHLKNTDAPRVAEFLKSQPLRNSIEKGIRQAPPEVLRNNINIMREQMSVPKKDIQQQLQVQLKTLHSQTREIFKELVKIPAQAQAQPPQLQNIQTRIAGEARQISAIAVQNQRSEKIDLQATTSLSQSINISTKELVKFDIPKKAIEERIETVRNVQHLVTQQQAVSKPVITEKPEQIISPKLQETLQVSQTQKPEIEKPKPQNIVEHEFKKLPPNKPDQHVHTHNGCCGEPKKVQDLCAQGNCGHDHGKPNSKPNHNCTPGDGCESKPHVCTPGDGHGATNIEEIIALKPNNVSAKQIAATVPPEPDNILDLSAFGMEAERAA